MPPLVQDRPFSGGGGCRGCGLRERCTSRKSGGRSLTLHPQEDLLQRLRDLPTTAEGWAALWERVAVEHGLAHLSTRVPTAG